MTIVHGLFGGYGIGLPDSIGNRLGSARASLEQLGMRFYLGGGTRFLQTWSWVAVGAAIAFLLPNTQQIMGRYDPALDYQPARDGGAGKLAWVPSRRWAAVVAVLCLASLLSLSRPAEFLYFQF